MFNGSIAELMEQYLSYGAAIRNYSPATLRAYQSTFRFFQAFTAIECINELTELTLESYFYHGRLNRHWSSVTFRQHYKHLNCFFKWLIQKNVLLENPLGNLEKPRIEKRLPSKLTREEAHLVLDTSFHIRYTYRFEAYRNRAIVGLMLLAGLRRSEVLNLNFKDIALQERMIYIQQGKGKKDRNIPISMKLYKILEAYVKERSRLKRLSIKFFTGVNEHRRFSEQGIQKIFKRLRQETKLCFTPHTLRHSFATLMLEGGCDIYTLSKIMGHSKITTTTIYLMCSNPQMVKSIEKNALCSF